METTPPADSASNGAMEFVSQNMADASFDDVVLTGASFWGVDLRGATFRDVDLSGARLEQCRLVDVDIDGELERIVINGVDVTDYVNEHDVWFALRSQVRPADPGAARLAWPAYVAAWDALIERVSADAPELADHRVDGEWSLTETLRHLVFATDKWFRVPLTVPVGSANFDAIGLPNSGSIDFGWPGIDLHTPATFADATAAWRAHADEFGSFLGLPQSPAARAHGSTALALEATWHDTVDVLENGPHTVHHCIGVVFEEHFQHLRYVTRDLSRTLALTDTKATP